ncbi:hypothetical protein MKW92_051735 [Papaver armeniacum]|nr:hypothetical protein MKW92_051735 [Papaver armeniacum]
MADETEKAEEKKIPVFTVLKKGSIVKNIYLDNLLISGEDDSVLVGGEEEEEIFIVGRHPDCNIMLEHPSISRFHLKIYSKTSSKSMSVMDLSSAHGTWISDQKIEPQVRVDLNEGDTLRLGASTRVYRLHWVPRSFDLENSPNFENPFSIQEKEEVEEGRDDMNEFLGFEIYGFLLLNHEKISNEGEMEHEISFESLEIHTLWSELWMPVKGNSSFVSEDDNGVHMMMVVGEEGREGPLRSRAMGEESVFSSTLAAVESVVEETSPHQIDKENGTLQSLVDMNNVLSELANQESPPMKSEKKFGTPNIWLRRGKSVGSVQIEIAEASSKQEMEEELAPDKENCTPRPAPGMKLMRKEVGSDEVRNTGSFASKVRSRMKNMEVNSANVLEEEIVSRILFPGVDNEGEELHTPDKENSAPRSLLGSKSKKKGILEEMKNQNSGPLRSKVSTYPNIDEDLEAEALFTPDKENITPGRRVLVMKSKKKGCLAVVKNQSSGSLGSKAAMHSNILQEEYRKCEEEISTPDKENFSPRPILGMNSMEDGGLEELKNFGSPNSKFITTPNYDVEEGRFYFSDKENLTPIVSGDSKSRKSSFRDYVRNESEMILSKREEGKVPFQSLLSPNSISKSKSESSAPSIITTTSCDSANFSQSTEKNCVSYPNNQSGEEANNRRWNMVVDTACLLDKESWKSLKLLEGIKGTHLIIPRMVIRELDSLKRRGSLFKRAVEVSSSAVLEWIRECMTRTNWWIHVQNSLESLPTAPTPPASPHSILREANYDAFGRALQLSSFGSLMEIASLTAQDHTLECALLFKRIKNNERLVVLSNDVALKIKAMAEGLICETAEEFRESLVNPYSERFMWAGSTPRGRTWSSFNDTPVLRETCYLGFPAKKRKSAESAKGLKLILLHGSRKTGDRANVVDSSEVTTEVTRFRDDWWGTGMTAGTFIAMILLTRCIMLGADTRSVRPNYDVDSDTGETITDFRGYEKVNNKIFVAGRRLVMAMSGSSGFAKKLHKQMDGRMSGRVVYSSAAVVNMLKISMASIKQRYWWYNPVRVLAAYYDLEDPTNPIPRLMVCYSEDCSVHFAGRYAVNGCCYDDAYDRLRLFYSSNISYDEGKEWIKVMINMSAREAERDVIKRKKRREDLGIPFPLGVVDHAWVGGKRKFCCLRPEGPLFQDFGYIKLDEFC